MRRRFEQVTLSCLRCHFCHAFFLHALNLALLGYSLLSFRSDSCALEGFQVQFLSDDDVAEDGIDGGGLFKEFLTLLLRELMNMDRCCSRSLNCVFSLLTQRLLHRDIRPSALASSSGDRVSRLRHIS